MKLFAKLTAVVGIASLFAGAAFAQTPPPPPPMSARAPMAKSVKGYTRKTKSGKVVTVKGYTRKPMKSTMAPKMTAIKGYTRKTKSGKVVTVKGYTRKAPMGAKKK